MISLQAHDVEARRLRDEMAALPKHVAALEAKAKATQGQRAVILDLIAKAAAVIPVRKVPGLTALTRTFQPTHCLAMLFVSAMIAALLAE